MWLRGQRPFRKEGDNALAIHIFERYLLGLVKKTVCQLFYRHKHKHIFKYQHFSIPLDDLECVLTSLIGFSGDQSAL